LEEGLRHLC